MGIRRPQSVCNEKRTELCYLKLFEFFRFIELFESGQNYRVQMHDGRMCTEMAALVSQISSWSRCWVFIVRELKFGGDLFFSA